MRCTPHSWREACWACSGRSCPPSGLPLLSHCRCPGETRWLLSRLMMHKTNDEPSSPFLVSAFKSSDWCRVLAVGVKVVDNSFRAVESLQRECLCMNQEKGASSRLTHRAQSSQAGAASVQRKSAHHSGHNSTQAPRSAPTRLLSWSYYVARELCSHTCGPEGIAWGH